MIDNRNESETLFDTFAAPGVTREEIAVMDIATITEHVAQLRGNEPDSILMTDSEIAEAILAHARAS